MLSTLHRLVLPLCVILAGLTYSKSVSAQQPLDLPPNQPLPADQPQTGSTPARTILNGETRTTEQDKFYRPDQVQDVYLQIAPDELRRMRDALPKRIYVPGSFRWGDVSIDQVGIRFKGNSSSHPNQQHKRSYLVKFDEYDRSGRFLEMKRVSFDNGVQFGSLFSEPIITEILRSEGIVTHRCNYARLYVNDVYQGVYVNVERIDDTFLERNSLGRDGSLFKVDEGGPGGDLQYLGDNPNAYERTFELKSGSRVLAYQRLIAFLRQIHESPPQEFRASLAASMELDEFLRVTAVMLFAGAFDQLTGWQPHNYYLHFDPQQKRWNYLPWDLDVGFAKVAFGRIRVLDDWHAGWPLAGRLPNPLLQRVIADPVLLKQYRQEAERILETYFEPEKLCRMLDQKYALIKESLQSDPFPHRRVTNPDDRSYDDIVRSMKDFIHQRYATARDQLRDPGPQPALARRRRSESQPRPGPPSDDAPTKLEIVKVTPSEVRLRWIDNATNEAATIVQRAEGLQSETFRNRIGLPGDRVTQATDRDIQPGKTYRYRVYSMQPTPQGPRGTGVSNVVTVQVPQPND